MAQPGSAQMVSIPLGVVVARTNVQDGWSMDRWRAVSVLLDPPQFDGWREMPSKPGLTQCHAGNLLLRIDRCRSVEYRINLTNGEPSVYVVLRDATPRGAAVPVEVRLVSASPFEVQPYRDSGIEMVDRVAMPPRLVNLVRSMLDATGDPVPRSGV